MKNPFIVYFFVFTLSPFLVLKAQKIEMSSTIRVTYNSILNLGINNKKSQTFILVGNSEDYYFAGQQNYLNDTKQYRSNGGIDVQSISDYFQERIIKTDNIFNVFYTFADTKVRYSEEYQFKWVLYGKTKMISGIKCQLATTNRYGRRWYAYFAPDYNQRIGPYKFSGLPGLILELFDTRDDYHFTVSKIEKFDDSFEFNLNNYAKFSKQNYIKAKYNLDFEGAGYPMMYGEMKKEYNEMSTKMKKMYNNPLELKPE